MESPHIALRIRTPPADAEEYFTRRKVKLDTYKKLHTVYFPLYMFSTYFLFIAVYLKRMDFFMISVILCALASVFLHESRTWRKELAERLGSSQWSTDLFVLAV
jgi:hypothetical protein